MRSKPVDELRTAQPAVLSVDLGALQYVSGRLYKVRGGIRNRCVVETGPVASGNDRNNQQLALGLQPCDVEGGGGFHQPGVMTINGGLFIHLDVAFDGVVPIERTENAFHDNLGAL